MSDEKPVSQDTDNKKCYSYAHCSSCPSCVSSEHWSNWESSGRNPQAIKYMVMAHVKELDENLKSDKFSEDAQAIAQKFGYQDIIDALFIGLGRSGEASEDVFEAIDELKDDLFCTPGVWLTSEEEVVEGESDDGKLHLSDEEAKSRVDYIFNMVIPLSFKDDAYSAALCLREFLRSLNNKFDMSLDESNGVRIDYTILKVLCEEILSLDISDYAEHIIVAASQAILQGRLVFNN